MQNWLVPRNLRELGGFLGLTGYYRKFVNEYASIASILTNQLRKDRFGWTDEAEITFNKLKEAMKRVHVLAMLDILKPFIVDTNVSGYGLGAVLLQEQRPIAYFSVSLGQQAQIKSVYEKELMAIALLVTK